MKFYKAMLRSMVAEWSSKYVDYKGLKQQINLIKSKAVTLAQAYTHITEITGEAVSGTIDLEKLKDEQRFWELVESNLNTINEFYSTQCKEMLDQFHSLVRICVAMDLFDEYTPQQKGLDSRLQREIGRLNSCTKFELVAHPEDEEDLDYYKEEGKPFPIHRIRKLKENEEEHSPEEPVDPQQLTNNLRRRRPPAAEFESTLSEVLIETETITMKHEGKPLKVTLKEFKGVFREFYRGLVLLEGYCNLNVEALQKIIKKHQKNIGTVNKNYYFKNNIQPLDFYKHSLLKILVHECELVFAKAFTDGHRTQAMDKLRVPKKKKHVGSSLFRFGVSSGISFCLLFSVIYILSVNSHSTFPMFSEVLICYRMLAMAVLMTWGWAFDMYIWTKYKVNYVFIFGFDARNHIRHQNLFEAASMFTCIWLISFYLYLVTSAPPEGFSALLKIPWQVHPFTLFFSTFIIFWMYQIRSRFWVLATLGNIIIAPFKKVEFRDFFLADQLVSISIVLYDFEFALCFLLSDAWTGNTGCTAANKYTRPLISMLPSLWRLLQCFRRYRDDKNRNHMINAGKYTSSIIVSLLSALRGLVSPGFLIPWLLAVIVATFYSFMWDIKRDWSLGDEKQGYLRKKLVYPKTSWYYWAIASNFLMRLMWTFSVSPQSIYLILNPDYFTAILAAVEIIRRTQWNLYRLENEQLNNVGKYRTTNVQVPPLDQERWDSSIVCLKDTELDIKSETTPAPSKTVTRKNSSLYMLQEIDIEDHEPQERKTPATVRFDV